jgi:hypothetical protein
MKATSIKTSDTSGCLLLGLQFGQIWFGKDFVVAWYMKGSRFVFPKIICENSALVPIQLRIEND